MIYGKHLRNLFKNLENPNYMYMKKMPAINSNVKFCCLIDKRDQKDIPIYVIKDATTRAALLILHKVVHRRVHDQSIFVDEIFAANFAREFRGSMMSFPVPLHVGRVDTYEIALVARHRFEHVRFLYMGVKHKLLRVILATGDAFEGSMNAVRYSQMSD